MIVKMLITFDYNPETNEYTPLKQEIVKDEKKIKTSKKEEKVVESGEATLFLYDNKYKLNDAAIELLGVSSGDRLTINYQIVNGINFPIIGSDTVWGGNSNGNKLTTTGTVSYRGQANDLLSKFGSEFSLIPYIKQEGLFTLVSNTSNVETDSNVVLPNNEEEQDLIEEVEAIEEEIAEISEENPVDDTELDIDIEDVDFEECYDLQDVNFNF
jgi:hypothetical protein